jgi:hypothetical protein
MGKPRSIFAKESHYEYHCEEEEEQDNLPTEESRALLKEWHMINNDGFWYTVGSIHLYRYKTQM